MANPYEPPRPEPAPRDLTKLDDDEELARLRKRLAVCGVAVGFVFGTTGVVQFVAIVAVAAVAGYSDRAAILLAVALFLTIVGAFALFGRPWTMYVAAAASALWLAWLMIYLPIDLAKDDVFGPDATVALYIAFATPGFAAMPFAVFGIATDRAIHRRSTQFARQSLEAESRS